MNQTKTLNNPETQNNLLNYNKNFYNSQNYIFGKNEKKKVIASFLGNEILKKILSYTSIIYLIIFYWFWFSLIFFIFYYYWRHWKFLPIIHIPIFFFIVWSYYFKNDKIENISDYFILKKSNLLNTVLLFITIVGLIITFIVNIFGYIAIAYSVTIFSIAFFIFEFLMIKNKKIRLIFLKFGEKIDNFTRINFLNLILLPIISPLWLLLFLILYLFSWLKKYQVIKNNIWETSILNFKNDNWIFNNWFYKIIKKQ